MRGSPRNTAALRPPALGILGVPAPIPIAIAAAVRAEAEAHALVAPELERSAALFAAIAAHVLCPPEGVAMTVARWLIPPHPLKLALAKRIIDGEYT